MINYNIISTGSKGNAVIINQNILIDCGVPFVKIKPFYQDFKLILLTHIHGDHFNKTTIKTLAKERPTLRFGCGNWLADQLVNCGVGNENIDVFDMNCWFKYSGFCSLKAEKITHNVDNLAYHIHQNRKKLFYATDTNSLDGIDAKNYDLYMVEANYEEDEIAERIKQKQKQGLHCYELNVLKNHLSKEKCDDFIYKNIGEYGEYVYLHRHNESDESEVDFYV